VPINYQGSSVSEHTGSSHRPPRTGRARASRSSLEDVREPARGAQSSERAGEHDATSAVHRMRCPDARHVSPAKLQAMNKLRAVSYFTHAAMRYADGPDAWMKDDAGKNKDDAKRIHALPCPRWEFLCAAWSFVGNWQVRPVMSAHGAPE